MRRRTASPSVVASTDLAGQGRRLMESGRWREAVESYKQLVKQDPNGPWQPALAAAYEKRAEELAGKAMFKEALILLDNADRLVEHPVNFSLRLTCLVAVGQVEQALSHYLREEAWLQSSQPALFPPLQEYIAVLLLTRGVAPHVLPADSPWSLPLEAAQRALSAFCHPDSGDLESLLGRISLRSPFKPLRLILKALLLVREQPEKAQHLVTAISEGSPWSRIARLVFLSTLGLEELLRRADEFHPKALDVAMGWRGVSPASWRRARELLSAPSPKLLSALVDPTFPWSIPDDRLRRPAFLLLVEVPSAQAAFERRFGPLAAEEKSRLSALVKERQTPDRALSAWQAHLHRLHALPVTEGAPLHLAMTHRHVSSLILMADEENPEGITHLEQSLHYDPGHRKSHRLLLAWYQEAEDDKNVRLVLDRALRHFPDEADFLHAAVRQALHGQTFKKAFRLAKRLLTIDPLHGGVRRDLVGACLAQARKQVRGGRVDLAEKELTEAAAWERAEEKDGVVRINQAFLAWLAQRQSEGDALLEEGMGEAGGGVAARLCAVLEGARMKLPSQLMARLMTALTASTRTAVSREAVMAVVRVAKSYAGENLLRQVLTDISSFLMQASPLDFSLEERRALCRLLAESRVYGPLERYAALGEKRWREQPIFVYYRLLAKYRGPQENLSTVDRNRLMKGLQQAEAQNDRELVEDLEDWLFDDDEIDFEEALFPLFSSHDEETVEGRESILAGLLTMVAHSFMASQRQKVSREEVREILFSFLREAAPKELTRLIANPAAVVDDVLAELFPVAGRRRGEAAKLPELPDLSGNGPARRGAGRSRGGPFPMKQLELDLDEP